MSVDIISQYSTGGLGDGYDYPFVVCHCKRCGQWAYPWKRTGAELDLPSSSGHMIHVSIEVTSVASSVTKQGTISGIGSVGVHSPDQKHCGLTGVGHIHVR